MFRFSSKNRMLLRHLIEAMRNAQEASKVQGRLHLSILDIVRSEVEPEVFEGVPDVDGIASVEELEAAIGEVVEAVEGPAEEVRHLELICG